MSQPPRYIVLVRCIRHWFAPYHWTTKEQVNFDTKEEAVDYITKMPTGQRNGYEGIEIYQRIK